jgi:hypothetical protein
MYRSKSNPQIMLRPQDVVVLLRLSLQSGPAPTYAALANPALYELWVLVDAIRGGSQRERALTIAELDQRWSA